jgi:hypothetical protein
VLFLGRGVGLVASGDVLGEVFGQVADAPARVLRPGEHALGVELGPEPGHMQRVIVRADRVEGLVPGGQDFARGGVKAAPLRGAAGPASAAASGLGEAPAAARRATATQLTARSVRFIDTDANTALSRSSSAPIVQLAATDRSQGIRGCEEDGDD